MVDIISGHIVPPTQSGVIECLHNHSHKSSFTELRVTVSNESGKQTVLCRPTVVCMSNHGRVFIYNDISSGSNDYSDLSKCLV